MERKLTLQQAAKQVIMLQDACNLSGLVHDFPNMINAVWEEARRQEKGTDWVNTHPIVIMMVSKLGDLSRYTYGDEQTNFGKAYDACQRLAEGT
jgi:hypothetical protein